MQPENERFELRRLCECEDCGGRGKSHGVLPATRCDTCRGEGRTLQLVATCATPEDLGVALVTLGREGEFAECPVGILDRHGEKGQKWLISPWLPSPRNVSDAGRVLQSARHSVHSDHYPDRDEPWPGERTMDYDSHFLLKQADHTRPSSDEPWLPKSRAT